MHINKRVLLLAILKKEPNENLIDIVAMLEASRLFRFKEGKRLLKELKSEGYIDEAGLTPKGHKAAKEAEEEFRL
ncbi:MAG: hypothetical protein C6H99_06620 [Epsilonproteobacteria bacterium]|nr:hypothetical protein [Campylobacterota bacterium]NPA65237.1 hypothetical protein [Campylobacterota bacterium]